MTHASNAKIVVLISGVGSNLQALIDASMMKNEFEIAAVISNRPGVFGLKRAQQANIPALCVDHSHYPDRELFDNALIKQIDAYKPDLLVLAGFTRILTPEFVQHYQGRALNIHPSLLPKYRGMHTHQRVLAAGDHLHGCSVHFVSVELDGGPVVMQSQVPVLENDTEEVLAKRVLHDEHIIFPMVVTWYTQGRLRLVDDHMEFDGKKIVTPFVLQEISDVHNPIKP